MRKLFVLIAVIVAISNEATSLKCYYCAGSVTSDCYEGIKSAMIIQDCNAGERNISTAKLSISDHGTLEDREDNEVVTTCVSFIAYTYGMTYIERGCGFVHEGIDICDYLDIFFELVDCLHCEFDMCN
ncbi:hypothetical protein Trydic_g16811 [Trypoxylus dichotomus]